MRLSLRWHIYLTLIPLLLILVVLGGTGAWLLRHIGSTINLSILEDFESVVYMERLSAALDGIDSSFSFALAGQESLAQKHFARYWEDYQSNLEKERTNITVPGEAELVQELDGLSANYKKLGDAFFANPPSSKSRELAYGSKAQPGELLQLYEQIRNLSIKIRVLNQEHFQQSSQESVSTANSSLTWFAVLLAVVLPMAGYLAWRTTRNILQPIKAVIESAQAISTGNLDQLVPVAGDDELSQLAETFNLMARHLRDFRQSQLAQLLRAQRTSQATIDSFPDPVLVIDAEGTVEMANPAARTMLDIAPKTKGVPGSGVWLPPEPLRQPLAEALQGQRDYLPEGFNKVILLGGAGRERAVLPQILTIRDPYNATLGAAVVLQDVTRQRLLDQMKSNLVATASHELKTPLTSIRLAVHLLFEEAAGPLTPKQTELLQDARDNCERLLAMVNNLLDLARFEQGSRQLELEPESVEKLLRKAADAMRPPAEEKGVAIVVDVPPDVPQVAADGPRIGTALRNLLDNALAHTDSGGQIRLSASPTPDGVTLSVADTGCGIAAEHVPHLFEKFYRVPGQKRGGGTGLGLAIVREIVTAHGGSINCSSRVGQGTIFQLTLPAAIPSMTPAGASPALVGGERLNGRMHGY